MSDATIKDLRRRESSRRWMRWLFWALIQSTAGLWAVRGYVSWDWDWLFHMDELSAGDRGLTLFFWSVSVIAGAVVRFLIWDSRK